MSSLKRSDERLQSGWPWWAVQLVLVAAATLAVLPMFFYGRPGGHDSAFHFSSWIEVARQWTEGIGYPRWAEGANFNLGEPRFIFYPPFSWAFGAGLHLILPWPMVPIAFAWSGFLLAANSMLRLARETLSPGEAVVSSVLYLASPYNFINAYTRCDFSEFLASALFPLLAWSALRKARDESLSFVPISIFLGAIWLTNAPAALIASYSLWLFLLVRAIVDRSWRPLQTAVLSTLGAFGLAACYILPVQLEQKWIHIDRILPSPQFTDQRFLFSTANNNPEATYFHIKVSFIALLMIGGTAAAIVLTSRLRRDNPRLWWPMACLGLASIFLMFPVSALVWRVLPKLLWLQFPWRWLVPLGAVGALLVASAVHQFRYRVVWWMVLGIALGGLSGKIAISALRSEFAHIDVMAAHFAKGYRGVVEYLPAESSYADQLMLPRDAPEVAVTSQNGAKATIESGATVQVLEWSAERKLFTIDAPAPATATLRLLAYPAWVATLNGTQIPVHAKEKTGQVILSIPPGVSYVQLRFVQTWDRRAGILLSIGTCCFLAASVYWRRRTPDISLAG